jgi:cyclic pyranopterin phosphate synthase
MSIRDKATDLYFNHIKHSQSPVLKPVASFLRNVEQVRLNSIHAIAEIYPNIIKPDVRYVYMALTSQCNLRCKGCDYGRDYMPKKILDLETVKIILDDLKFFHIPNIWLYGGEPLIHKDLVEIVSYACHLGLHPILGTNAVLLKPDKMDSLYQVGLRQLNIGIYGTGDAFDQYVDRKDRFAQLEENLAYISEKYPDVTINFAWLLMKPTCNEVALQNIVELAQKYGAHIGVQLIHYDFPYFNGGENDELQFHKEDLPQINDFVKHLAKLKQEMPNLFLNSVPAINAMPDWLLEKEKLEIPCYMYDNIWVAANGDVMVCQKNSILGNIHQTKFRELLYTDEHTKATRDSFHLNCSRCHVKFDIRTRQHPQSRKKYGMSVIKFHRT